MEVAELGGELAGAWSEAVVRVMAPASIPARGTSVPRTGESGWCPGECERSAVWTPVAEPMPSVELGLAQPG